jgi:hypothetical protein
MSRGRQLWEAWKVVATRIGHFQSRVLMVVLYFVALGPIAVCARLFGDPIGIKVTQPSWTTRTRVVSLETARRQF